MKVSIKSLVIFFVLYLLCWQLSFADNVDRYQNAGDNNLSYDLTSKFYVGCDVGYTIFTDSTVKVYRKEISIDNQSIGGGGFAGFKYNDHIALEINFQHLGKLDYSSDDVLESYKISANNLSAIGVLTYPVIQHYFYTISFFGRAGYGVNIASYSYNTTDNVFDSSGSTITGAYNFGLGINLDFRTNVSVRVGYSYYQAKYQLLGDGTNHGASMFVLGLYYNFG